MNPSPDMHKKKQPVQDGADQTGGGGDVLGGAGDLLSGAVDAAGGVLEGAGGCLDGCSGCSLAVLVGLLITAQTAFAVIR